MDVKNMSRTTIFTLDNRAPFYRGTGIAITVSTDADGNLQQLRVVGHCSPGGADTSASEVANKSNGRSKPESPTMRRPENFFLKP
jgi:hypothetical protein